MAISQSRLISLIAAADDYRQALFSLKEQAFALSRNVRERTISPSAALDGLLIELQQVESRLKFPIQSTATLAEERAHFRSNAKRNESAAKRAKRKRREAGMKEMPPTRLGLMVQPNLQPGQTQFVSAINTKSLDAEVEAALAEQRLKEMEQADTTDKDVDFGG